MGLEEADLSGQTIDIGGPENLTNMEVVALYEKLAGRTAKVSHIPLGVLKVMYQILRPLHPGLSQVLQSSTYLDSCNFTFNPESLLAAYPVKLTRLEDWATQRIKSGAPAPSLVKA